MPRQAASAPPGRVPGPGPGDAPRHAPESPSTPSTRTSGRPVESTHRTPLADGQRPPDAVPARPSPRLLCSDLDGTLLTSAGTLSPGTRVAVEAARADGLAVVFATGRPVRDALACARENGFGGLAACSNGTVVVELPGGRVLRRLGFPPADTRALLAGFRAALPGVVLGVDTADGLFLEPAFARLVPHCWPHLSVPDAGEPPSGGGPAAKLLAVHPAYGAEELAGLMAAAGPPGRFQLTHSTPHFVEVSPAGADKGAALHWLAARHGVRPAETVAVGDMPNDLPMLRAAGLAAAVANAHPEVLGAADLVVPGNDQDGVAELLHRLRRAGREVSR